MVFSNKSETKDPVLRNAFGERFAQDGIGLFVVILSGDANVSQSKDLIPSNCDAGMMFR